MFASAQAWLLQAVVQPFAEFAFMRRALVACAALALAGAPIGCVLVVRRMSLIGDAMAHALLPGAAVGFALAGFSLWAMGLGALAAALLVAAAASGAAQATADARSGAPREDAHLAAFYLIALAAGVLILSLHGSPVDLMHVLFGSILAVDDVALLTIAGVASLTLLLLALLWRPLLALCVDPGFLAAVGARWARWLPLGFMALVVLNLVAGFQALGTLMAVGLMMLPAVAARFWARTLPRQALAAALIALAAGVGGLLASFHYALPSGPAIVLLAGLVYAASLLAGPLDSVRARRAALRAHLSG
jgi:zinc/manganese transport system permease protein